MFMSISRFLIIASLMLSFSMSNFGDAWAQYRLQGRVVDLDQSFPLSSASIQLIGTNQGTISNAEGLFSIWIDSYPVSVRIRHIGYSSQTVRLTQHQSETRLFRLRSETLQLEEVDISDEDPALSIMRKVIDRKARMRKVQSTFEADSFTRFFLYRRKYRDDVLVQVKEQIGQTFWRKGEGGRQYVHSEMTKPDESGSFKYVDIQAVPNLNDDHLEIFGTKYIAPTHPDALQHYTFRFGNKKSVDGNMVYEIYISPKSASKSALVGRLRILDEEYVVLDASVKPNRFASPSQPITDFDVTYDQQFAEFEKGIWLPIDFSISGWLEFGRSGARYPRATYRQTTRLTKHLVNGETPDSLFAKSDPISYDPIYKFRSFLFDESTDFVQLTEIEARDIEKIRPDGKLSDEFIPMGLLAGYAGVSIMEKNTGEFQEFRFPRPSLWFNRVDGFRLGLSEIGKDFKRARLYFRGGVGFSRLEPDLELGLKANLIKRDKFKVLTDFSLRDQLSTNLPFSSWSRTEVSIPVYIGSPDYFDYHRRRGVKASTLIESGRASIDLGVTMDELGSVTREASETPWLFDRIRRENPEINSRRMISPYANITFSLPGSLPRGLGADFSAYLQQNFDSRGEETDTQFQAISLRGSITIPTFSYRRSTPSSLVVQAGYDELRGATPDFVRVGLDTSVLRYGRVGVFTTRNEQALWGTGASFISWEKRLETLPFEWLRLYPLSDRGMGLSVYGNHGWLKSGTNDQSGRMKESLSITPRDPSLPVSVAFIVEREGKKYYAYEWQHPAVAASVVLRAVKSGRFLLIKREHEPEANKYAFPGGFLDVGQEKIEETAARELLEEAGVTIPADELSLIDVRSDPHRDPRDHAFDIGYYGEIDDEEATAMDETLEVRWFSPEDLDEAEDLAFDHNILWKNTKNLLEL